MSKNGGEIGSVLFEGCEGSRGGGEKVSACSVSWSRIAARERVFSQGGGRIFARRWRLSRRASQSGTLVLWGGLRGLMGPYVAISAIVLHKTTYGGLVVGCWRGIRTPRSSSPSSLWRGMIVMSSISHRKAISGGVSPGGRGNAMLRRVTCTLDCRSSRVKTRRGKWPAWD